MMILTVTMSTTLIHPIAEVIKILKLLVNMAPDPLVQNRTLVTKHLELESGSRNPSVNLRRKGTRNIVKKIIIWP